MEEMHPFMVATSYSGYRPSQIPAIPPVEPIAHQLAFALYAEN